MSFRIMGFSFVEAFILPHLADRPLTMIRMPDGIRGQRFFQKHWEHALPEFVEWGNKQPEKVRYGTSGKPVPGYGAKIVGDDGHLRWAREYVDAHAADLLAEREVPVLGALFGTGCDGELTPGRRNIQSGAAGGGKASDPIWHSRATGRQHW